MARQVSPTTSKIFMRARSSRGQQRLEGLAVGVDVAAHLPAAREQEVRPETHHGSILARAPGPVLASAQVRLVRAFEAAVAPGSGDDAAEDVRLSRDLLPRPHDRRAGAGPDGAPAGRSGPQAPISPTRLTRRASRAPGPGSSDQTFRLTAFAECSRSSVPLRAERPACAPHRPAGARSGPRRRAIVARLGSAPPGGAQDVAKSRCRVAPAGRGTHDADALCARSHRSRRRRSPGR